MFAPIGYTPLSVLWRRFRLERGVEAYASAANYYHSEDFSPEDVRGSPADICEHLFLKSISFGGVHLASADGKIMRIDAALEDGKISLLSVLSPLYSDHYFALANGNETEGNLVRKMGGMSFVPSGLDVDKAEWWKKRYPLSGLDAETELNRSPMAASYHCIPFCFQRDRYCVVERLPEWTEQFSRNEVIEPIVRNFGGWSICLSDEDVVGWEPYLMGKPVYDGLEHQNCVKVGVGRPSKRASALADYNAVFPNGSDAAMKVKLRMIKDQTGRTYSESTLRRALDEDEDEDEAS